jgi:hypothetical protein
MVDGEAGRPEIAPEDPEKEALKRTLAETQKELCVARESLYVRRVLDDYAAKRAMDAKRGAKKNRDERGCSDGYRATDRLRQRTYGLAAEKPVS